MKTGELSEQAGRNVGVIGEWMRTNGDAIRGTKPLPAAETASVPAVAKGNVRYLFALPEFKDNGMFEKDQLRPADATLTLKGVATKDASARFLGDGSPLQVEISNGAIAVQLPASKRTRRLDVVRVELQAAPALGRR